MLAAFTICLSNCLAIFGASDSGYDSMIETLRAAQISNEGRYPQGSLSIELRRGQEDSVEGSEYKHQLLKANIDWIDNVVLTDLVTVTGDDRDLDEKKFLPSQLKTILDRKTRY